MKGLRTRLIGLLAAGGMILLGASGADAQQLERAVVSNAGGQSSNGTTTMTYTVGEPVVGTASNNDMTGTFGFWTTPMKVSSVAGGTGAITSLEITPMPLVADGTVEVSIARPGLVEVALYSATGELVTVLDRSDRTAGLHSIDLPIASLSSGTFFVTVRTPGAMMKRSIVVTK